MFCSLILVLKTLYLYNDIIHLSYQTPPFSVFLYQYLIILLKKNVGNFKNSDLGGLAAKIEVQQKNNIDICTLSTGLYYCVNCKNMPPQWVGCYLQVMRLDSNWCYMIAYEPYNGTNAIATTKCYEGTWSGWIQRAQ